MLQNYPPFNAQYNAQCIQIFIAAMQQYNPETSDTAYCAIISLNNPGIYIMPEVLTKSLMTEGCIKGALCYMLAGSSVIATPLLIDRLITLSSNYHEAMILLLLFAERPDSFTNFFPEYQANWLIDGRVSLEASVQIMAILMCHKEFRPYMIHISQINTWLCMLAQSTTNQSISFTALFLEKVGLTKELVAVLKQSGYFKFYIDSVISLNDSSLYPDTIYLIDRASRLDYIDDFKKFDSYLVSIALSDLSLYVGAISALTMRSMSLDGSESIRNVKGIEQLYDLYGNNAQTKQFIDVLRVNCS